MSHIKVLLINESFEYTETYFLEIVCLCKKSLSKFLVVLLFTSVASPFYLSTEDSDFLFFSFSRTKRFQIFTNGSKKRNLITFIWTHNTSKQKSFLLTITSPMWWERLIQRSINIFIMKPVSFLMERRRLIQTLKFLKLVHWSKITLYRLSILPDLS